MSNTDDSSTSMTYRYLSARQDTPQSFLAQTPGSEFRTLSVNSLIDRARVSKCNDFASYEGIPQTLYSHRYTGGWARKLVIKRNIYIPEKLSARGVHNTSRWKKSFVIHVSYYRLYRYNRSM